MRVASLLVVVGLAGCAEPTVSLGTGPREYVPGDYSQVLKRWTRDQSVIALSELEDKLTVTATFESWDFRWAYVVRYADDYRLTVEQRHELLERTLRETADNHEFYVALYGTNWRWTDLSRPTSAWIVRLIDDQGNETAPSKIEAHRQAGAPRAALLSLYESLAARVPDPVPPLHGRRPAHDREHRTLVRPALRGCRGHRGAPLEGRGAGGASASALSERRRRSRVRRPGAAGGEHRVNGCERVRRGCRDASRSGSPLPEPAGSSVEGRTRSRSSCRGRRP